MKELRKLEFNSLSEQKEYIQSLVDENKWIVREIKNYRSYDNFYGSHNLNETLEGMDYGFQANTDYFLENITQLQSDEIGENIVKMDVEGFAYDMGAVVAGEPECCVNMNTRGVGKTITINLDIGFSWQFTSQEINNRSIAIVKLINTLITQGYIINLYICCANNQDDMDLWVRTKIDTSVLNISTIAFVSSPEYFRQVMWITQDKLRNKASEPGRGTSFFSSTEQEKELTENGLFIPGFYWYSKHLHYHPKDLQKRFKTVESATEWVEEIFNDYCNKESEVAA